MLSTNLKRIRINGYKSIEKLDLQMSSINILIGANGAGKSNFISLFTFLQNLSEGKLQSYVEKNGFASTFFHSGTKKTQSIKIGLDVGLNGYYVEFVHGEAKDNLVFNNEYCTFEGSSRTFTIQGELGESGLLSNGYAESRYVRKYTKEYLEQCRVYHFHDTSKTALFKQAQKKYQNIFLQSDAANIAPFLLYLKEEYPENYRNIVKTIQTVAPFFHDFSLIPQGKEADESILLRWIHKEYDNPFSANELSDGTARFICLVTLFLQPVELRPNTIILDEPELGLHPAALEVLSEIIKSVADQTQIICSSQSVTFANFFEPEHFIVVDQIKGVSEFKRLETENLKIWLEDFGMGDIWMKNLIGGRPEW